MGGPLWTQPEEDFFWLHIVANSDKKIGYDKKTQAGTVKSWEELTTDMQQAMATKFAEMGLEVPRKYTALTLSEHYDKNIMQNRVSKTARDYVDAYVEELRKEDGARWARREKRLGKKPLLGEDEEESGPSSKKRKRAAAATARPTPSTAGLGPLGPRTPWARTAGTQATRQDDDEDDYQTDDESREPIKRQLFHSYGTAGPERRPLPTDNPYAQAPRREFVTRREVQGIVATAVENRMLDIGDIVRDDIHTIVNAAIDRRMETIRPQIRDEITRQLSSARVPEVGRDDTERRATANLRRDLAGTAQQALSARGYMPPPFLEPSPQASNPPSYYQPAKPAPQPASQPASHPQQEQYHQYGHGEAYTHRQPPMGQFPPIRQPSTSSIRTALPTGRGQFSTSNVRSGVRDRRGNITYGDDEDDEEMDDRV